MGAINSKSNLESKISSASRDVRERLAKIEGHIHSGEYGLAIVMIKLFEKQLHNLKGWKNDLENWR